MNSYSDMINEVSNQICWSTWRGYHAAVFFELGGKRPSKNGEEPTRGTYTIALDMCDWEICKQNRTLVTSNSTWADMDAKLQLLKNKVLLYVDMDEASHVFELHFSDKFTVKISLKENNAEWHILKGEIACVFQKDQIFLEEPRND
jgi:hypothetical protein